MDDIVARAYNDFMTELFGEVPKTPSLHKVDRDTYEKAMHKIQDKYGLEHGHPQFLEWVLTITGRSPKILKKELGNHDDKANTKTMGEASPRETER